MSSSEPARRRNPARPLVLALAVAGLALVGVLGIAAATGALNFSDPGFAAFAGVAVTLIGLLALGWAADRVRTHMKRA